MLSAAMGYITSDVSVEIANDRLAGVDVISMISLLNEVLEGPDQFWVPYFFITKILQNRLQQLEHNNDYLMISTLY